MQDEEENTVVNTPKAKAFRKEHNLWGVDLAIDQGQIKAGEVDKEHVKFLEKTEFVKEEVKENE